LVNELGRTLINPTLIGEKREVTKFSIHHAKMHLKTQKPSEAA
jgi:hypothetical protein